MADANDYVFGALNGMVKSIRFDSNAGGGGIDEPFAPKPKAPPGMTDAAMEKLAPTIIVELREGEPLVIAPWGRPSPEAKSKVRVGAVVGGVAGLGILAWLIGRRK